jgi:predicted permease
MRSALVVVQVALATVLLTGASLMVYSLQKLYELQLGFQPEQLLTLQTQLPVRAPYADPSGSGGDAPGTSNRVKQWKITQASLQFPERVIERLLQTPGVRSAAVASGAPMIRTISARFQIEGRGVPSPEEEKRMDGPLWYVTPGYFRTLRIDLRQGRDFDQRDSASSPRVAVVNEFIAKTWWPDRASILGERIQISPSRLSHEIVGVAADVRAWPLQQTGPQLYVPVSQNMQPVYADRLMLMRLQFHMLVRTSADPASVAGAVRSTLREVAEDAPLERVRPMTEVIGQAFRPWRSTMLLFAFTGGLSLLLAAVGIYGVISYATTRRVNEIGIRIAMGANPASVTWLVMKSGLVLIGVGALLGVSAAYGLTRFIASQLFEVRPADPSAIAGAALILVIAGLAAC